MDFCGELCGSRCPIVEGKTVSTNQRSREGSAGFLLDWEKTTDQVKFDREFVELVECVSMIFKKCGGKQSAQW